MNVLLATPYLSQHYDAGLFWAAALSRPGHLLTLWDYRREHIADHHRWPTFDVTLVMKGNFDPSPPIPSPHNFPLVRPVCYWPDKLGRDPESERWLSKYHRVYTCLRPTPDGMIWLPGGFDPVIHRAYNVQESEKFDSCFVGTATESKAMILAEIKPSLLGGNGWTESDGITPIEGVLSYGGRYVGTPYLHDLVGVLNNTRDYYKKNQAERVDLWEEERMAISPYTYEAMARRIVGDLQS